MHVHEEYDNSLMPHTTGAIVLCPKGNSQGSHYFLNLNSGHRIVHNHWTTLPMPAEVIHNVHRLVARCKNTRVLFSQTNNDLPSESDTDSDKFQEITGVDGMNNNCPYQNNATSDDEIVAMEEDDEIAGVDSNSDEFAGVATEEDDKIAGVTAQRG